MYHIRNGGNILMSRIICDFNDIMKHDPGRIQQWIMSGTESIIRVTSSFDFFCKNLCFPMEATLCGQP